MKNNSNIEGIEPDYIDARIPGPDEIFKAFKMARGVVAHTPLLQSNYLSQKYKANVYLKRQDMQQVRSFKLRGTYNKVMKLSKEELKYGVTTGSAGNHAQGLAYVCKELKCKGTIFMPVSAPTIQKRSVKFFGGEYVDIVLHGDTFDQAASAAMEYAKIHKAVYIPAYDDIDIVIGQGTVAVEILMDMTEPIDFAFVCVGGGGLCAGISSYFHHLSPDTRIIGCEPLGSPSMAMTLQEDKHIILSKINTFVDGAAIGRPGIITWNILKQTLQDPINLVPQGAVCTALLNLYDHEGVVSEPAGALAIAGLEQYKEQIIGQTVVCTISGNNNDLTRMMDIQTYSRTFQGQTKYLLINFYTQPGAFQQFLLQGLQDNDEIIAIEFTQQFYSDKGPALVGIDFHVKENFELLKKYMIENQIQFTILEPGTQLFMTFI